MSKFDEMKKQLIEIIENVDDINMMEYLCEFIKLRTEEKNSENKIEIVGIGEYLMRLRMLCDNMFLIRMALFNEDFNIDGKVTDNALTVIEEEIRELTDKIDDLLCRK